MKQNTRKKDDFFKQYDPEKLYFIPLGGAGHFGANLNLFIFNGHLLIIDLGMGFGDSNLPGVDLVLPDIRFVEQHKDRLLGIVATHAHEDHIGGIPYLWNRLECPVYATPFTASIIKKKLDDASIKKKVPLHILDLNQQFNLEDFSLELVTVTHSIPEPNAIIVKVDGYEPIVHTGDWKLDEAPIVGEQTDFAKLKNLANEGVLAVIGDSTNAHLEGHSLSELDVQKTFVNLFGKIEKRIAVVCFSSNIARIESIAHAAAENGRHVALVGRSLWRMVSSAKETGYLSDIPEFLSPEDASFLAPEKVVYICTGSQGEARAALAKIAFDTHAEATLEAGDTVIFSSRAIPGNEKDIIKIKNALAQRGIHIIDEAEEGPIHVSGHPYKEELVEIYQLLRPRIVIPVHGEHMMQTAHAEVAQSCQISQTIIPQNGQVIEFSREGKARFVDEVSDGSLLILDGDRVTSDSDESVINRGRLTVAGTATVTVVVDPKGRLVAHPVVSSFGLIDGWPDEQDLYEDVEDDVARSLPKGNNDEKIAEAARLAVRRFFKKLLGKKPMTKVHFVRLED